MTDDHYRIDGMLLGIESQWLVEESRIREEQREDEVPGRWPWSRASVLIDADRTEAVRVERSPQQRSIMAVLTWPLLIAGCGAFWVLLLLWLFGML